jgi:cytidylate kinase
MVITIDGPSGSGKSTVAQILAQKLGFYYLNTGLLYRALAFLLLKREGYTEQDLLNPRTEDLKRYLNLVHFSYHYSSTGHVTITFEDLNITPFLKDEEIGRGASVVSTNQRVREALHDMQHRIAQQHDIVIEGRDSGSVVFPHAEYKFFLTASLEERARRWQEMQKKRGVAYSSEQAVEALQERDTRDEEREAAPLCIPSGAIVIDSTHLEVTRVLAIMLEHIRA